MIAQFAPESEGVPGGLIQRLSTPAWSKAGTSRWIPAPDGIRHHAASDHLDAFTLEPVGAPKIEGLSVQGAVPGADNARRLSAQVDPTGVDTHYYFEYGTASCASMPSACTRTSPTDIGGGFGDREVSLELHGLAPGAYHYRVVAENPLGTLDSPERAFPILELPSGLPDGRAREMVSPPDKHGAPIEALTREGGQIIAAEDGDALAYVTNGAIEEEVQGNRSFELQQALAVRGPEGWVSKDIATPNERAEGYRAGPPEYQFFSADLSVALVEPFGSEPSLAEGAPGNTVYLRDDPPIVPGAAERQTYAEAEAQANSGFLAPGFLPLVSGARTVEFLGAAPDLDHVVFSSGGALTGPSSAAGLYEWSTGGALQFLSALPDGEPAPSVALGYYRVRARTISDDGTRVIWTASQETPSHLYMRDVAAGRTVQLDAARGVQEPASAAARFQTASADGSRVFFTDAEPLVKEATGEPAFATSDLYVCELAEKNGEPGRELQDLTIPCAHG